tara:strand:- start:431 stop:697 length:267 start_codon:yes stop_codon:yes gene_type:complete
MYVVFTFLFLLCQKDQIAMVIIKYKVVQTGAKIQLGGLYDGFINNEYQGSLNPMVAIPPITDAEYVTKANNIKDKNLFLSIYVLYISL